MSNKSRRETVLHEMFKAQSLEPTFRIPSRKHLPDPNSEAYILGFEDGYDNGVCANPFNGSSEASDHLQYKYGYDAGVATYCRELGSQEG